VIAATAEYEKAQCELRDLQERLAELQRDDPIAEKGPRSQGFVN